MIPHAPNRHAYASRPSVIAHRGVHTHAPENTIAAFDGAVEAGADMIELDVRRTADGKYAIVHDPLCDRTPVDRLTLTELRDCAHIDVPTLPEVLDWARGRIALDVELKEDGYVPDVAALLTGFTAAGGSLLVTSFNDAVLRQLPQELPTGLLLSFTARSAGARARACGAGAIVVEYKLLSDAVFEDAATHALDVYVWDYLPGRDGAGLLDDRRVAGIVTDDVPGVRALLTQSAR